MLSTMRHDITIDTRWDEEAGVWLATSAEAPGLVIEAETWPGMIPEVRAVLPELLALTGRPGGDLALTFRAEEHLHLAGF